VTVADVPVSPGPAPALHAHGIPIGWLAAALLAVAAVDNLLLPVFFGLSPGASILLVGIGAAAMGWLAARGPTDGTRLPVSTVGRCFAIAASLLLLGGEGRLFYAAADWQVRDAVLADLARHAWPFVYVAPAGTAILRAPLGMYLLPSLAGADQAVLDGTLLASNTLVLGLLLALASTLFDAGRPRRTALTVFLLFGGLDAIGTLAMRLLGRPASLYHLENWSPGSQYTATISQLFWSPQHAIAGWTCALFFLLWHQRKLPLGAFAATIPLLAFWSPLAAAGGVPFVVLAAGSRLRQLRRHDVAVGALAVAIAIPALLYQHLDAARVGGGPNPIDPAIYAAALLLEVAPFALPLLLMRPASGFGRGPIALAVVMLLLAPLWQVGTGHDFQMRTTIVPLAILAAATADLLLRADGWQRWLIAALALASLSTASELFATLTMRPAPPPRCSLIGAWYQQTGMVAPMTTYLASTASLPSWAIGRRPAIVYAGRDPARCWSRPWLSPWMIAQ
jgi:hypothetical protein